MILIQNIFLVFCAGLETIIDGPTQITTRVQKYWNEVQKTTKYFDSMHQFDSGMEICVKNIKLYLEELLQSTKLFDTLLQVLLSKYKNSYSDEKIEELLEFDFDEKKGF